MKHRRESQRVSTRRRRVAVTTSRALLRRAQTPRPARREELAPHRVPEGGANRPRARYTVLTCRSTALMYV